MSKIIITRYPEQTKSVAKLIKSMKKIPKERKLTDYNIERLKALINEDMDYMVYIFTDYNEEDELNKLAEETFLSVTFNEEDFLRLLAKNSLTNRIVKAYHSKEISDSLKYRVRECAVAFKLYNSYGGSDND